MWSMSEHLPGLAQALQEGLNVQVLGINQRYVCLNSAMPHEHKLQDLGSFNRVDTALIAVSNSYLEQPTGKVCYKTGAFDSYDALDVLLKKGYKLALNRRVEGVEAVLQDEKGVITNYEFDSSVSGACQKVWLQIIAPGFLVQVPSNAFVCRYVQEK